MITGLIALIIVVGVIPPAIDHVEIGVIAVTVIFVGLLLMLGAASRESDRAYNNCVRHLANGRYRHEAAARSEERTKVRNNIRYIAPEAGTTQKEKDVAAERRKVYMAMQKARPEVAVRGSYRVCHACGRGNRVPGERIWTSEGKMVTFVCPRCGMVNLTKLG